MITVELSDRIFQYDCSVQGAEDIISYIAEAVSESGMVIDCMNIDGTEIYTEYDKYIKENIDSIRHIYVNLITRDEFIIEILLSKYSYIQGVLPKLQPIIDSLYTGEANAANIDDLANLTEGITWIFTVGTELIDRYFDNKRLASMLSMGYREDIQRLREAFEELKNAIMNMDYILMADILNYEVSDVFNKIADTIQELELNNEGTSKLSKQH